MRFSAWRLFLFVPSILCAPVFATEEGKFLGAIETEYPEWFKESFLELEEDVREAAENDKRLLVFFHQDGCPYCNLLVERNLAQKDIEQKVRRHFDVVVLNMWGDREVVTVGGNAMTEKTFAQAAKVQFTPTLMFFNPQGEVALRLNGYHPPHNFNVALDYVKDGREKELSYREYLATREPVAGSKELNPQSFFSPPPYNLSSAEKPLAVFFEQRQCPNCDTLHGKIMAEPQTRGFIEQFHVIQLDMWSDTPVVTPSGESLAARDWAESLEVSYAPTIVFFDASGREVIRTDSYFKTFHTQSVMDYVLSGAYNEEASFQRYISDRADALRARGIDVDIWR